MRARALLTLALALLVAACGGEEADPPSPADAEWHVTKLSQAVTDYLLDNKQLPQSLQDLLRLHSGGEPYIDAIPTDPWGNDYTYTLLPDREYEVRSPGPDGTLGNDDDIVRSSE